MKGVYTTKNEQKDLNIIANINQNIQIVFTCKQELNVYKRGQKDIVKKDEKVYVKSYIESLPELSSA